MSNVLTRVIRPDGTTIMTKPKNGSDFSLGELQAIVGGYVEIVQIKQGSESCIMVVNEDGISKNLPANLIATELYGSNHGFAIVGTVLICKQSEVQ